MSHAVPESEPQDKTKTDPWGTLKEGLDENDRFLQMQFARLFDSPEKQEDQVDQDDLTKTDAKKGTEVLNGPDITEDVQSEQ